MKDEKFENVFLYTLGASAYYSLNKKLVQELGVEKTCLIAILADALKYHKEQKTLTDDGYFFLTLERLEQLTGWKEKKQKALINELKKKNILEVKLKGLPAKRYFKLNYEAILKLLTDLPNKNLSKGETTFDEKSKLQSTNGRTIKQHNILNNINIKKIYIAEQEKNQGEAFNAKSVTKTNNVTTQSEPKEKYLDFVFLTKKEYQKLCDRWGKSIIDDYIERLDAYIGSKGKRYKSHYHTLLNWLKRNNEPELPKELRIKKHLKIEEDKEEDYEINSEFQKFLQP